MHHGLNVVALLRRTGLRRRVARSVAAAVLLGTALGGVGGLAKAGVLPEAAAAIFCVVAALGVMSLGAFIGANIAMGLAGRASLGRTGHGPRARRRAERTAFRAAQWQLSLVAARRGVSGLSTVADHVRATVPPGDVVRAHAASAKHAHVYAKRFGFVQLTSRPWQMVATVTGTSHAATPPAGRLDWRLPGQPAPRTPPRRS
ncbi:hypothetical protein [Isoptericola croceus]|uniref:hypothetical protein n=1 Tax=Isoptericola croceus TaxID=3031406 RepID=UPI0023F868E2|nr:hypothetical protein [Isoptericola croceus]